MHKQYTPTTEEASWLRLADELASHYHEGQKMYQSEEPYITHVRDVATRVNLPRQKVVALLHDIIEDTTCTLEILQEKGFPSDILYAVQRLTKEDNVTYQMYIDRLDNPYPISQLFTTDEERRRGLASALMVKRADIIDHLDRKDTLKPSLKGRYERALLVLTDTIFYSLRHK